MKENAIKQTAENSYVPYIVSGVAVIALGGVGYWIYQKQKNSSNPEQGSPNLLVSSNAAIRTKKKVIKNYSKPRPKGLRSRYVLPYIKYGSRHPDVKILQRYLKFKKADIGATGKGRDGIDGIFGPKTLKASKKYLKKAQFSRMDINGMKATLQKNGIA